jgi:hypothetical protein
MLDDQSLTKLIDDLEAGTLEEKIARCSSAFPSQATTSSALRSRQTDDAGRDRASGLKPAR